MEDIKYLTPAQLEYINQNAVQMVGGNNFGIQSISSFEVVIEQPQQVVFGQELYPTLWIKAAFIMQKITKKHVFVDGNKRTSIMAAMYFLHLNGFEPKDEEVFNNSEEFVLTVTNSPDTEETMLKVAKWLELMFIKKENVD
ncbi:MAG: type II toxin-antitoxin system death-on-curing family toxin [Lactobacillaceae bacterium]|jgi:death-on-curing protein|nr:type II toxin-antitoxin system death-on-curing family toxin [Lactobacillaceae bacterium]